MATIASLILVNKGHTVIIVCDLIAGDTTSLTIMFGFSGSL